MIGRTFLHYEVIAELGVGSMGRVYAARDTHTGRQVALKFVEPDALPGPEAAHRLAREARATARLSHPGIVSLLSFEETAGLCFLVEEYVEGETLAHRLERGPLGAQETLRLAGELVAALTHAHAHGVLHRDLKPENILIASDGTYKVADFGVARIEGVPTTSSASTLLGTLPYIAPERLRGHRGDARADLFSVGAILYEAMTGRRAFPGLTEAEVCYSILNQEVSPIAGSGPAMASLTEIVMKLLAKEPSARPASAGHLGTLVAAIGTGTPAPRPQRHRPWLSSRTALAGSLVLVTLAIAWGAYRLWMRPSAAYGIAVLPFENVVDPQDRARLGPVVSSLLIASMAEGHVDSVLSSERVMDILHSLGRVGGPVDRHLARAVAQRAHARRIATGSILRVDGGYLLTVEISETASGRIVDIARVEGNPGQSVFEVVDLLSAKIVRRPLAAVPATFESMRGRRTNDLLAYQHYVAGLENLARGEAAQAARAFSSALERDPGFELATYQLGFALWLSSSSVPHETP